MDVSGIKSVYSAHSLLKTMSESFEAYNKHKLEEGWSFDSEAGYGPIPKVTGIFFLLFA